MGVFQKLNDQGITSSWSRMNSTSPVTPNQMVVLRDGKIVTDDKVAHRLNARVNLLILKQAQAAVKLA